jgi:hypothetical protein
MQSAKRTIKNSPDLSLGTDAFIKACPLRGLNEKDLQLEASRS